MIAWPQVELALNHNAEHHSARLGRLFGRLGIDCWPAKTCSRSVRLYLKGLAWQSRELHSGRLRSVCFLH